MPVVREPESREFPLAPQGLHNAVCVDIWPIWTEERPENYGGGIVDKTRLVWHLEDSDSDGKPFEVSKKYTPSLHEKASLRKDLQAWRGRTFTKEELAGFELDNVIGVCCQLNLIHNVSQKNGKTYANIAGIMPLGKGTPKILVTPGYVRKKDRASGHEETNDEREESPF